MPIVFVPRTGPPENQLCPMVLCEMCGGRIYQNRASSPGAERPRPETGIATSWARYVGPSSEPSRARLESSPLFYVHQGACDRAHRDYVERFYRPDDGWVNTWDDIREVIKQLVHNTTHPLESDTAVASGKVSYHPPARIVDLRPQDFATTPQWFVGNPDTSA